jgi:hypothetical protein
MDHGQAVPLISEWARGRLDAARSREVEAHVRVCRTCQQAAEAAARLAAEAQRLRRDAGAHPASDELARYVETPQGESIATLARVGVHLRDCPPCREDVALLRAAAAPAWRRGVRAWLGAPGAPMRALQPALAVLAALLVYPAWLGLVEYPRERTAAEHRIQDAESRARAEADARAAAGRTPAPVARGGGIAALVLRGATRGPADVPVVRLRRGQAFQPVLVDATPPAGRLSIALVREPEAVVWTAEGPREDFWDDANQLIGALIPAEALAPGEYRLEVRPAAGAPPALVARFRVVATP